MKRAMILFCLMALTATAWGRHLGRTPLEERYDRFKDRTTVTTQRVLLSSGFRNLGIGNSLLSFTYGCPGQEAKCQPESVIMLVETVSSGTWLFINCNELIFLADGARIAIGAHWDGGIASGKEWMIGEITPTELRELASAKKLEVKLGAVEFKSVPAKDREAWIELADRLEKKN